ncbi:hypothetical protein CL646_03935 [bacterium]|nr:hypothetical protein [bacterium]
MSESYGELLAEFSARERISDVDFVNLVNTGVQDEPEKQFRDKRNSELNKTDKYATIDFPHPNKEKRKQWLQYRQELRDLPANTENIKKVVWPKEPEISDSEDVYEDMDTQLGNLKTDFESKRAEWEAATADLQTTRTQLKEDLQTELEVTKLKLLNTEARLKMVEQTMTSILSKLNV